LGCRPGLRPCRTFGCPRAAPARRPERKSPAPRVPKATAQSSASCRNRDRHPETTGGSSAQQRLQEVPEPKAAEPDDPEEVQQFSALVRRALLQLRGEFQPTTWQAFWRTTVDDQPSLSVAAELGISANGVRMAKSRVPHRLREELGDLVE